MPGAPSGQKKKSKYVFKRWLLSRIMILSTSPLLRGARPYPSTVCHDMAMCHCKWGFHWRKLAEVVWGVCWPVKLSGVRRVVQAILMHMASSTPITVWAPTWAPFNKTITQIYGFNKKITHAQFRDSLQKVPMWLTWARKVPIFTVQN